MYSFKVLLVLSLLLSVLSRFSYAQDTEGQAQECSGYAEQFLESPDCDGLSLSSDNCSEEQISRCLGQRDMTLYNKFACCSYDVKVKLIEQAAKRKLKQSTTSCFRLYTAGTIKYETENIVPILRYCKYDLDYKTNYSVIIGDQSVLDAVDEPAPTPESSADQAPQAPSSASYLGFSGLAVALLLGFLMLV